ncbi:hypothetical protein AB7M49_003485 [Bradyrhizobium elkanii]|uniref:Uncharacterized protein n=1 Tax=Bradyrhizobium elkanii TaxID=29448 RepID=A0A8I1Y025_BRAEL|nr:hypothetical protein [Bradyrhizobium elkanii]MCS4007839.1 hypothetical protein [Bradyrhizobium elkanii USDA 61]MCP1928833.1 hypothetical protein [Bradyrhizobium elkanii]MCP1972608.1 hypothetical protein [Bradyrhizobium elkanii]MCS3473845.1 hypothetical protein [Bradyrhizobium elkanii]
MCQPEAEGGEARMDVLLAPPEQLNSATRPRPFHSVK